MLSAGRIRTQDVRGRHNAANARNSDLQLLLVGHAFEHLVHHAHVNDVNGPLVFEIPQPLTVP